MGTPTALQWRELWSLYCSDLSREELDQCAWLQQTSVEWPSGDASPVEVCDWLARLYSAQMDETHRKARGQFFTPPAIARFMAGLSAPLPHGAWVVEPGAGTGILLAALAEHLVRQGNCREWRVTAYEIEPALRPALALALGYLRRWLNNHGVAFNYEVRPADFILSNSARLRPAPLLDHMTADASPHLIISNPPYFKIPKSDPRVVDHYFRISSGNTQVSATELRNLPLPPLDKIRRIGERLQEADGISKVALITQVVGEELNLLR